MAASFVTTLSCKGIPEKKNEQWPCDTGINAQDQEGEILALFLPKKGKITSTTERKTWNND